MTDLLLPALPCSPRVALSEGNRVKWFFVHQFNKAIVCSKRQIHLLHFVTSFGEKEKPPCGGHSLEGVVTLVVCFLTGSILDVLQVVLDQQQFRCNVSRITFPAGGYPFKSLDRLGFALGC